MSEQDDKPKESDGELLRRQLGKLTYPDNCEDVIGAIVSIANIARREGLLSLEQYVGDIKDPLLRALLKCIIDGVDPAESKIIADNHARAALQRRAQYINIVRQGMESVQDGHRPQVIAERVHAILGDSKGSTSTSEGEAAACLLTDSEINKLLNL
ncbi:MAG TPA: hypothetical protein PKM88_02915 [bacterium]|nr:hypothetical protein [bacterium]